MRLLDVLDRDGEGAWIVGGAVRNTLLGLPVSDIDLATTARPEETVRRARAAGFRVVPTGIEHGTVTVIVEGRPFEVTTLREDVSTDGRHAVVRFGRDLPADARRRDFTVNALYADASGRVIDPVGGLPDLAGRRVRFIGDADARIAEDYLRIMRFFRFHAAYAEGALDPEGLAACVKGRDGIARLSRERVGAEFMKTLLARGAVPTIESMRQTGLLDLVLGGPSSQARLAARVEAGSSGPGEAAARLAALAVETPEDAERLRERLRLSNEDTDRLHAFARTAAVMRAAAFAPHPGILKETAYRHGLDALGDARLVVAAAGGDASGFAALSGWTIPSPPWTGGDVLHAGAVRGPAVGRALARAQALWIAADFPTSKEALDVLLAQALAETG